MRPAQTQQIPQKKQQLKFIVQTWLMLFVSRLVPAGQGFEEASASFIKAVSP